MVYSSGKIIEGSGGDLNNKENYEGREEVEELDGEEFGNNW